MKLLNLILCLFLCTSAFTQNFTIKGKIFDNETGTPLVGATILAQGTGEVSDLDGVFAIELNGPQTVEFSYVGYEGIKRTFDRSDDQVVVNLLPAQNVLDQATVTGSRFEQKLSEATVSIDIIPTKLIENTNTIEISDVLVKVPGVQILDGTANIRGGSGFAFGAGARVLLLLNDMPILSPDRGFPDWADIPVENVSQVEVLKGASSALYGSAAMNGIINVRTKYATAKPQTDFSISGRLYDKYDRSEIVHPDGLAGDVFLSASHRSKITKDWDLVLHGAYINENEVPDTTSSQRGRIGFSSRYRISDRLTIGLNSQINLTDNTSFFIWSNKDDGILFPLAGTISSSKNTRFILDPTVTYFDKSNAKHKFQSRYYYLNNRNNNNQSSASRNIYSEYQYQRDLESLDAKLTLGLVNQYLNTDSELFQDVKFTSYNFGGYFQADKKIGTNLDISAGARYEYNTLNVPNGFAIDNVPVNTDELNDGDVIGKVGISYRPTTYTSFRGSFGQAYRFPTIVERFISTTFGAFQIFSNPELRPENGWTSEIGVKQGFNLLGFKGFLDFALFRQEYQNMMEFTFVSIDGAFGFQSQNISDTEINGLELSVAGQVKFDKSQLNLFGGYTYINPEYKNLESNFSLNSSLSTSPDSTQNVLKYRNRHMFKLDVEYVKDKFRMGLASNIASEMINIDKAFEQFGDFVGQIGDYRQQFGSNFMVLDARASYQFEAFKLSLLLNNFLNEEYTVRPAELMPPRSIALRFDMTL